MSEGQYDTTRSISTYFLKRHAVPAVLVITVAVLCVVYVVNFVKMCKIAELLLTRCVFQAPDAPKFVYSSFGPRWKSF